MTKGQFFALSLPRAAVSFPYLNAVPGREHSTGSSHLLLLLALSSLVLHLLLSATMALAKPSSKALKGRTGGASLSSAQSVSPPPLPKPRFGGTILPESRF